MIVMGEETALQEGTWGFWAIFFATKPPVGHPQIVVLSWGDSPPNPRKIQA